MSEGVDYEVLGNTAWLTFNRPGRANALHGAGWRELARLLCLAEEDPEVALIAITGAARTFCAGDDIVELRQCLRDHDLADQVFGSIRQAVEQMIMVAKPTIAVVNGAAIGGGCEIALLADITIAADDATFAQPEARIGAWPAMLLVFGPHIVGAKALNDLAIGLRVMTAEEAREVGLVTRVVASEELMALVGEYEAAVSSAGSEALEVTLLRRRASLREALPEFHNSVLEFVEGSLRGAEMNEGVEAFLLKREPKFALRASAK